MDLFEYIASPYKQTHIRKMCQYLQEMFQKNGPLTSVEWKYLADVLASPVVPNDVRKELVTAISILLLQVEGNGSATNQGTDAAAATNRARA